LLPLLPVLSLLVKAASTREANAGHRLALFLSRTRKNRT
jgi:hypothetical protein